MIESNTDFDAEELVALARTDLRQTRLDRALNKLKHAVQQSDCPSQGFALIGQVYADLGLFRHAQKWLRKYVEINPESPTELFQLGLTYLEMGDRGQARELWSSVLKLMPNHPPALYFTAMAATMEGRTEDARRDLMQLFRTAAPDNQYVQQGKELLSQLDDNTAPPLPSLYAVSGSDGNPGALPH